MRYLLVGMLLMTGCAALDGSQSSSSQGSKSVACDGDRDACKIEGPQIGVEGLVLDLGSTTVTFHDWLPKHDEPDEFIGFSIKLEGASSINYVVKAGGEMHPSSSRTWIHTGVDCHAISNVDFPDGDPNCDNPDGCGDGGDGDPGCDNPDGCDGGGGGGDGPVT